MIEVSRAEDGGIIVIIKGEDQRELTLAMHPDSPNRVWAVRGYPNGNPQGCAIYNSRDLHQLARWLDGYRGRPERVVNVIGSGEET